MKYAFVTGSTKGIGKAIGFRLLQEGYFVIFNGSSQESIYALKTELKELTYRSYDFLLADMSDLSKVESIKESVSDMASNLDLLVFNTGLTDRALFGEIEYENWLKVFNANINMPMFLMQAFKPSLNTESNIIFIGSMLGNIPHSVSISYGVSKSAVHALVKNMVKFLSKDHIRINAIAPGFVDTDWQKEKPEWLREKIKGKIALNRFAEPNEVAEACIHIILNKYLTGQVIQMDGGYSYE